MIGSTVGLLAVLLPVLLTHEADCSSISIHSPDRRNSISLTAEGREGRDIQVAIIRDNRKVISVTTVGPIIAKRGSLSNGSRIIDDKLGKVDDAFELPWGKAKSVSESCQTSLITLTTPSGFRWQIELRAYNDGVVFRYVLPQQEGTDELAITGETTRFEPAGTPTVLFNTLSSFTTSHESLYQRKPLSEVPADTLIEMPFLFYWSNGSAAAITESRVRHFAGGYLRRDSKKQVSLGWRLSPHPRHEGTSVIGKTPIESPWRAVLLGDSAGKLLESNVLLCLNDPPRNDFSWAQPGKTSFHWWYGEFEDDFKLALESDVYLSRHKRYIDFCAKNKIAYHSVSGDGLAWYVQSKTDYGTAKPDADVRVPRPELKLPEIIEYARKRGVGIRLWVHWIPLSEHLEEAFTLYESWGIKGLMVDFLDRDDQEMIDWTERMLESAARHKLHIQIHGSPKNSGEQRTFPNLFNREGVLNLEYDKWSQLCTPQHAVDVAYTRALAGPVDFHLGGFRSSSRSEFQPRDRAPVVMGTRCHHLALYVVYENPMPMVADAPQSYEGQAGFEFIRDVPTTWDETRFVTGEPGEYIVLARRSGKLWYLAGITNWTKRELDIPLDFVCSKQVEIELYVDGSMSDSKPNAITIKKEKLSAAKSLHISMASGGGFVAILGCKTDDGLHPRK